MNNLNSVQFPEFYTSLTNTVSDEHLKKHLFSVAEYERRCLEHSLAELKNVVDVKVFEAVQVFFHTADMYGQM
jgi:hypothetical protein